MEDLSEQALREARLLFKERYKPDETLSGAILAFINAVDWKEPWILSLIALELVMLASLLVMRRNSIYLGTVFVFCMVVVFTGETLNSLGAQHWKKFSKQAYFDENGIFFSSVISAPLLLIMMIVLVLYLLDVAWLMVKTKRKELAYRIRQQALQSTEKSGRPKED